MRRVALLVSPLATVALAACGSFGGDNGGEQAQRLTVVAQSAGGEPPSRDVLERTGEVLVQRLSLAGFPDASAAVEDSDRLVLTIPGEITAAEAEPLLAKAQLRFRKVLASTSQPGLGAPVQADQSNGATPALAERAAVRGRVGEEVWDAGLEVTDPAEVVNSAELSDLLAPLGELTPAEAAALPARIQYYAPVTCNQLNARPSEAVAAADQLAVACDAAGKKFLLAPAAVTGDGIEGASVELENTAWRVHLEFTDAGQAQWSDLTGEAADNQGSEFDSRQLTEDDRYTGASPACDPSATGGQGGCLVAVVLDGTVVSAPEIMHAMSGDAVITADFSREEVERLANQVQAGVLPMSVELHTLEPAD